MTHAPAPKKDSHPGIFPLTYSRIGILFRTSPMPRAATTSDPFNAIAEPRRRDIINLLAEADDRTVNDIVDTLRLPQPAVSKHLRVLRKVGLVTASKDGRNRRYRLVPHRLRPVHVWIKTFERFWTDHLDTIQEAAERKARERAPTKPPGPFG